jgi:radical SAM superfamily enzyme YgiQ (UPF0313 family)
MNRTIILLDLPWTRDKDPRVPLGHASLLTALRTRTSVDVRSLIIPFNELECTVGSVCARILAECGGRMSIDLAIGVYVWCDGLISALIPELRRKGFGGRIILGGPQISYAPAGVAKLYPGADVFVRGFAEAALCELAEHEGRARITGVVYRDGFDQAVQAEPELAAMPSPWLTGVVEVGPGGFIRWETQRGCPYRCSFCQHREAGNTPPRHRADEVRLAEEIQLFADRQVDEVAVLDPVFNSRMRGDVDRPVRILERFVMAGYTGRLSLQCRPELIDSSFLEACETLDTQLEFGLQTVVPEEWGPIQRGNKLEKVDMALRECRRRGIDHQVSLIFGLPGQTVSSFERSLSWCLSREIPVIKAFPLMLLRGTELERDRERWNLRETDTPMPVVCASDSFDEHDWLWMAQLSEALRASERGHPTSIDVLRASARGFDVDYQRWTPASVQSAHD